MNNLKNYSKPVMQMEQFVPQEYVAACWMLHVWCEGPTPSTHSPSQNPQKFVFNYPGGSYVGLISDDCLGGHWVEPKIFAQTADDNPPPITTLEEYLHGFTAAQASTDATNHNGTELNHNKTDYYTVGYSWANGNDYYHFMRTPEWTLRNNPNAPS